MSILERLAQLSDEELAEYVAIQEKLRDIDDFRFESYARPEQLQPEGDWLLWLLVTGRRWGKTLTAAQWLRKRALEEQGVYAICAPTFSACRDICVEGGLRQPQNRRSGFLSVCADGEVKHYNRSQNELTMVNGSKIKMLSADEPDSARGWGFHAAWCDELSSWRYPAMWYETLLPAVSMSNRHRFIVTTTPKRNALTMQLIERAKTDPTVTFTRGHTLDNVDNLGIGVVEELRSQMSARLIRQELEGELLEDVPGALATQAQLDASRVKSLEEWSRTLVSVDPAVTNTDESDHTGIAVQRRGVDGHCYLVADLSCKLSVDEWARRAVQAAVKYEAGMILYEKNQGADAIGSILQRALINEGRSDIKLKDVTASQSKFDRALALQQWIEQGRWHLVGLFPDFENEITTWTVDAKHSPDRLDAVVHGFRELMLEKAKPQLTFRG